MAKSLHQLTNKHFSGRNCGKVLSFSKWEAGFLPGTGHPFERLWQILLQKSQIAERQFFRQKTRQAVIAD
jgi:hypothetical protein